MRTLLAAPLALGLAGVGCTSLPSGRIGVDDDDDTDDDDDAANDDDAADDDDIAPDDDDDATPPIELKTGFVMWDPTAWGGGGGDQPAAAYAVLPRGSLGSCEQFLEKYGYDVDDDFAAVYIQRGPAVEWPGTYLDFYADCRPHAPDARCFAAWGNNGGDNWWESGVEDSVTIETWTEELVTGTYDLRGTEGFYQLVNCGEVDLNDDYDGANAGGEAGPDKDEARSASDSPKSSWGLRLR